MTLLLDIFLLVTLPIILLIAVGWAIQERLPETRKVLSLIYANVVVPAFMVHFISTSELPLSAMWPVVWFTILQGFALAAFGWLVSRALRYGSKAKPIVALGGSFGNVGNFGLPVVVLAFPTEFTVHQSIIVATTAIMFVPLCSLLLSPSADSRTWRTATIRIFTNPIVLSVLGGLLLKISGIILPVPVAKPLQMMAGAYTTIALLGLGATLHGGVLQFALPTLRTTLVLKLLLAPLLTWLLASLIGFSGLLLALLIVSSSLPAATLVAVLSAQNEEMREAAASTVFVSTLLAPFTVSLWIFVTRYFIA